MSAVAKVETMDLPPLAPQSEAVAVVSMLERMINDPTIDLSRIEKVLEMRKAMEEDAQRKAFNAAMAACKAELPQVVKNAENTDNKSQYATLDKIGHAIDAVIAKYGFSTSFNPAPGAPPGFQRIEATVAHTAGHERHYTADLPLDAAGKNGTINKTPIHAWGSTMSYGRRYLTMMIFDVKSKVATPDDDGRGANASATIGAEKAIELMALIKEFDADLEQVLKYYKIETLPDLPVKRLAEAERAIRSVAK
jgi:hypothetical protein